MSILYAEHRCLVLGIFYFHPFPFAGTRRTLPPLRPYALGTRRILLSPIPLRQRDAPYTPTFMPLRARHTPPTPTFTHLRARLLAYIIYITPTPPSAAEPFVPSVGTPKGASDTPLPRRPQEPISPNRPIPAKRPTLTGRATEAPIPGQHPRANARKATLVYRFSISAPSAPSIKFYLWPRFFRKNGTRTKQRSLRTPDHHPAAHRGGRSGAPPIARPAVRL